MKNKMLALLSIVAAITLFPSNSLSKGQETENIVLSSDNLLVLNAPVDGDSVGAIIKKVREIDSQLNNSVKGKLGFGNNKPIYLFLYTPGGSIQSGLELIEALRGLGRPVHTITSFSASMGFQIVQSLNERYVLKSGVLMSHRAKGGFDGEFGGQSPSQVDARYSFWLDRLTDLDNQTVTRTNGKQSLESYQKQYASEMWLTGPKAVEQGYADKVVTVKCDKSLNGVTTQTIEFFGMGISYDLDNCPLNTAPMNIRIGRAMPGASADFQSRVLELFAKDYNRKMATIHYNYDVF